MTKTPTPKSQTQLKEWTDAELVNQAQATLPHNTQAFQVLLERHEQKVFHLCLRYLDDDDLAQDVSQEVFLKVFQQLKNFRGDAQFSTWLYRITLNTCHTQYGKKSFNSDTIDHWLDDLQVSAEDKTCDEADCIQHCLNQQAENERAMITLRFNADLSIQEIADILNIKLSAAKMRLYRALDTFKKHYETFCL